MTESHVVWRNTRGAPFVPSAILVGDFYYLIDDQGIGTCLNAHTGERVWQKRFTGKYTASPIAADGRIYFVNEAGLTTVIQAGVSNYVELARNNVGEAVFASPSIAQRRLFIRTSRHLFCIGTAKSKR
ncbi:MAG: PQQ-binding-like beta-propeller repeat protein [Planctomycetaceae bacterium]|nr:PQQ-binding-like beta-propeller repeat protein [Planctomycetaceae bacterium]